MTRAKAQGKRLSRPLTPEQIQERIDDLSPSGERRLMEGAMELVCKRCGSGEHVRNGRMRGKQRYRCKACGLNFTDTPPRGLPFQLKVTAVLLYVSGLSMNRTAKLLGVSTPSVMTWIEQFAKEHAPKPAPEGRALVIELDETWHYLKKKDRQALGVEGLGSCFRPTG